MSFVKYRVKEVATDFGKTPKEIADIISKYYEKPKSNTQVLNDAELNALFDDITRNNQIGSLEQVFILTEYTTMTTSSSGNSAAATEETQGVG